LGQLADSLLDIVDNPSAKDVQYEVGESAFGPVPGAFVAVPVLVGQKESLTLVGELDGFSHDLGKVAGEVDFNLLEALIVGLLQVVGHDDWV